MSGVHEKPPTLSYETSEPFAEEPWPPWSARDKLMFAVGLAGFIPLALMCLLFGSH